MSLTTVYLLPSLDRMYSLRDKPDYHVANAVPTESVTRGRDFVRSDARMQLGAGRARQYEAARLPGRGHGARRCCCTRRTARIMSCPPIISRRSIWTPRSRWLGLRTSRTRRSGRTRQATRASSPASPLGARCPEHRQAPLSGGRPAPPTSATTPSAPPASRCTTTPRATWKPRASSRAMRTSRPGGSTTVPATRSRRRKWNGGSCRADPGSGHFPTCVTTRADGRCSFGDGTPRRDLV
jgi:hypothetical protein